MFCSYDDKSFIGINSVHCIQSLTKEVNNKFLLLLINSNLCNWFFRHENFHMVGKPLAEVKVVFVERLPIVVIDSDSQQIFIQKADKMLEIGRASCRERV